MKRKQMPQKETKSRYNIMLSWKHRNILEKLAARENRPLSNIIESAIDHYQNIIRE